MAHRKKVHREPAAPEHPGESAIEQQKDRQPAEASAKVASASPERADQSAWQMYVVVSVIVLGLILLVAKVAGLF